MFKQNFELNIDDLTYEWLEKCEDVEALKRGVQLIEEDGDYFVDLKNSIKNKLKKLDENFRAKNEIKNNMSNDEKQNLINDLNNWAQMKEKEVSKKEEQEAELEKTKGNEALLSKDYPEAIVHYDLSLKLNPKNFLVYSNKAQAYLMLKDYKNAIREAAFSLQINPDFVKGYYRRAKANEGLKNYFSAACDYKEILKREENNTVAFKNLQTCMEHLKESEREKLNEMFDQENEPKKFKIEIEECSEEEPEPSKRNHDEEEDYRLEQKNIEIKKLIQIGNFLEAIQKYEQLLQGLDKENDFWLIFKSNLCHCHKQNHDDRKVISVADEIINYIKSKEEMNHKFVDFLIKSLMRKGFSLERQEKFKDALLCFGIVKKVQHYNMQAVEAFRRNSQEAHYANGDFDLISYSEKIDKEYRELFKVQDRIDSFQELLVQEEDQKKETIQIESQECEKTEEKTQDCSQKEKPKDESIQEGSIQLSNIERQKITDLKMQGNELFKKKKFGEAIQVYSKAIDKLDRLGDYTRIRGEEQRMYTDILSNRSLAHHYEQTFQQGLSDAVKALNMKPQDPKLLYRAAKNSTSLSKEIFEKAKETKDIDVREGLFEQTIFKTNDAIFYVKQVMMTDASNVVIQELSKECKQIIKKSEDFLREIKTHKESLKAQEYQEDENNKEKIIEKENEQNQNQLENSNNEQEKTLRKDFQDKTEKIAQLSRQHLLKNFKEAQTATQFETDLKAFENDHQSAFKYLMLTNPELLQSYYKKNQFEVAVLLKVVKVFSENQTNEEEEIEKMYNYLENFSKTKSFKLATSMLLKKEKQIIESILERVELILMGYKEKVGEMRKIYKIKKQINQLENLCIKQFSTTRTSLFRTWSMRNQSIEQNKQKKSSLKK